MSKDIEYFVNVNLKGNELKSARIENVTALPEGKTGLVVYLTTTVDSNEPGYYYYSGTSWAKVSDKTVTDALAARVKTVEDAIGEGGEGLGSRVSALETTVGDSTSGLVKSVADNAGSIATNAAAIADVKKTADSNTTSIGTLTEAIGADATAGTVKGRITALETTVNDASTGLVKKVADNTTAIAAVKATADAAAVKTETEAALAKKVDKVDGKGLSTEDFTSAFKTKLEGIEAGAQVNKVTDVTVGGVSILDGTIAKLVLDEYAKKSDLTTFMRPMGSVATINDLPADASVGDVYNVQSAFTNGVDGKVYPAGTNVCRVKKTDGTFAWDPLGGQFDFSQYYTKTEVDTALGKKQDNLSDAQLAAANSGITTTKVATYDGYSALITAAKAAADAAQTTADKKVDALTVKPTAGTFTKVTISAEGLVTGGATLDADDIPSLAHTKISDFDAAVVNAGKVVKTVEMAVADDWTAIPDLTLTGYPASITVFNGSGEQIFVATKYSGGKVYYQTNVAVTTTVVIGL